MNHIKKINDINQRELNSNVSDAASWHADYRDTAYIYVGNLPKELREKDIVVIFSQFGVPTHVNLIKDRDTGESRGFCYLKYEDYRSCILAVDNFNGIRLLNRPIRVDHTYFKLREGETEDMFLVDYGSVSIPDREKVKAGNLNSSTKLLDYRKEEEGHEEYESASGEKTEHVKKEQADESDDEFRDPAASFLAKEEDEFKDPMASYLETDATDRDPKEKTRRHHHHRHHHRHKSSRSQESSTHDEGKALKRHKQNDQEE